MVCQMIHDGFNQREIERETFFDVIERERYIDDLLNLLAIITKICLSMMSGKGNCKDDISVTLWSQRGAYFPIVNYDRKRLLRIVQKKLRWC